MKIYFSHVMPTYGTDLEKKEKQLILENIPNSKVVDPGSIQDNPEKRKEGMKYCLKLVKKCDSLVFSRFKGEITSGVGKEVNYAIEQKINVFELNGEKLHRVEEPIEHLSIMETISLPGYYANR